jgi:hypothetical protein
MVSFTRIWLRSRWLGILRVKLSSDDSELACELNMDLGLVTGWSSLFYMLYEEFNNDHNIDKAGSRRNYKGIDSSSV